MIDPSWICDNKCDECLYDCCKTAKVSKSAVMLGSTSGLVERLVDEAMKIAMFDMPWDDESVPEVKSNRAAFRSAFGAVIGKRR